MNALLLAGAALSGAMSVVALLALPVIDRNEKLKLRIAAMQREAGCEPVARSDGKMNRPLQLVALVGNCIARSGLLSVKTLEQLQQTVSAAGLRGANGLALFVGSKMLLAIGLPLTALLWLHRFHLPTIWHHGAIAASVVIGLLLPDYAINSARNRFFKRLDVELPDALDMMVICSEAGLGLEAAIQRVAEEIAPSHPAIAGELGLTESELRVSSDRRLALQNLGIRTGLESLRRLSGTLIQTLQYGTPLSHALRTLSAEMRAELLVKFEARAARLPVLLTLPMIVFILPTVFAVVGGPAMMRVLASLHR